MRRRIRHVRAGRNAKQKLELENKQLHSKLEAMEHMQGDEDSESKKKMAEQIQEGFQDLTTSRAYIGIKRMGNA